MKITSLVQRWSGGTKTSFACGALLVLFAAAHVARGASASELLEKGIYTEETKGELQAAGQIYQQIVNDPKADRSLVAQAQLRLGLCELKLGHKPQAISALEHLTQEFPDKDQLLALVEKHMPQLLDDMLKQIEQNYIREVDRSELMETALRAIVGKLDSSAGFLDVNEVAQMNEGLVQRIGGIGAALKADDATHEVLVQSPLPNSPALKAGLRPGDRIVQVNGGGLPRGKELETAVRLLRGTPGSTVKVGVKRAGAANLMEIELVRDVVRLPSVLGDRFKPDHTWDYMLDESRKIGYLRLTQLGQQSPAEMQAALEELQTRGMKALILDLRNNPGGLLDAAVAVSDLFVESGTIITVKGRSGEQVYSAHPEGTFSSFPMVVLVNRKTASAAEIITACLQDHHRAIVVGERTVGQGLVRSLIPLKGGLGALRLPIAAYFRPSGKSVNRYPDSQDSDDWGVQPDAGYEVTLSDDELKQYEKYRSQRDVLNSAEPVQTEFQDRQLLKALDAIAQK